MQSILPPLIAILGVLNIAGCNTASAPATNTTSRIVTVVGDETAPVVIGELAKHGIQAISTLDRQSDSSLVVVVQDSTVGPRPIHLEIAKSLQKRPPVEYFWVFTNTSMVDDQELLELEELECREIFNSQGLPGDEVMFGFDSPRALVRSDYHCPKGWNAIIHHINRVSP